MKRVVIAVALVLGGAFGVVQLRAALQRAYERDTVTIGGPDCQCCASIAAMHSASSARR